MKTVFTANS